MSQVRSIHVHPTLPFLASCGLDRFARVYHTKTRELVHKIYLKQKLNWSLSHTHTHTHTHTHIPTHVR